MCGFRYVEEQRAEIWQEHSRRKHSKSAVDLRDISARLRECLYASNCEGNSSETGIEIEMHECWLGNLSESCGDTD